jgi:hypothetical protein
MRQTVLFAALSIMLLCGFPSEASAFCEADCIRNCERVYGTVQPDRDTCVNTTHLCRRYRGRPCWGRPGSNPYESVVGPKAKRPSWTQQ